MPNELEDREMIREVLYRYCYATDAGDTEAWVGGFTDDCTWDGGPFGLCLGKDEMRAYHKSSIDTAMTMRHLTLNTVIDLRGDRANAVSYVLVLLTSEAVTSVVFSGFYEDLFVRSNERWLIRSRKLRPGMQEISISEMR